MRNLLRILVVLNCLGLYISGLFEERFKSPKIGYSFKTNTRQIFVTRNDVPKKEDKGSLIITSAPKETIPEEKPVKALPESLSSFTPGLTQQIFIDVGGKHDKTRTEIPVHPDEQYIIPDIDLYHSDDGLKSVERIFGYFKATLSGIYIFEISSKGESALSISTTTDKTDMRKFAEVKEGQNVARRQYEKFDNQKSTTIPLKAGRMYYIEVIHKRMEGPSHVQVGANFPDRSKHYPIESQYFYSVKEDKDDSRSETIKTDTASLKTKTFEDKSDLHLPEVHKMKIPTLFHPKQLNYLKENKDESRLDIQKNETVPLKTKAIKDKSDIKVAELHKINNPDDKLVDSRTFGLRVRVYSPGYKCSKRGGHICKYALSAAETRVSLLPREAATTFQVLRPGLNKYANSLSFQVDSKHGFYLLKDGNKFIVAPNDGSKEFASLSSFNIDSLDTFSTASYGIKLFNSLDDYICHSPTTSDIFSDKPSSNCAFLITPIELDMNSFEPSCKDYCGALTSTSDTDKSSKNWNNEKSNLDVLPSVLDDLAHYSSDQLEDHGTGNHDTSMDELTQSFLNPTESMKIITQNNSSENEKKPLNSDNVLDSSSSLQEKVNITGLNPAGTGVNRISGDLAAKDGPTMVGDALVAGQEQGEEESHLSKHQETDPMKISSDSSDPIKISSDSSNTAQVQDHALAHAVLNAINNTSGESQSPQIPEKSIEEEKAPSITQYITLHLINNVGSFNDIRIVSSIKPEGYILGSDVFKLKIMFKYKYVKTVIFHGIDESGKDRQILLNGKKEIALFPIEDEDDFKTISVTAEEDKKNSANNNDDASSHQSKIVSISGIARQPQIITPIFHYAKNATLDDMLDEHKSLEQFEIPQQHSSLEEDTPDVVEIAYDDDNAEKKTITEIHVGKKTGMQNQKNTTINSVKKNSNLTQSTEIVTNDTIYGSLNKSNNNYDHTPNRYVSHVIPVLTNTTVSFINETMPKKLESDNSVKEIYTSPPDTISTQNQRVLETVREKSTLVNSSSMIATNITQPKLETDREVRNSSRDEPLIIDSIVDDKTDVELYKLLNKTVEPKTRNNTAPITLDRIQSEIDKLDAASAALEKAKFHIKSHAEDSKQLETTRDKMPSYRTHHSIPHLAYSELESQITTDANSEREASSSYLPLEEGTEQKKTSFPEQLHNKAVTEDDDTFVEKKNIMSTLHALEANTYRAKVKSLNNFLREYTNEDQGQKERYHAWLAANKHPKEWYYGEPVTGVKRTYFYRPFSPTDPVVIHDDESQNYNIKRLPKISFSRTIQLHDDKRENIPKPSTHKKSLRKHHRGRRAVCQCDAICAVGGMENIDECLMDCESMCENGPVGQARKQRNRRSISSFPSNDGEKYNIEFEDDENSYRSSSTINEPKTPKFDDYKSESHKKSSGLGEKEIGYEYSPDDELMTRQHQPYYYNPLKKSFIPNYQMSYGTNVYKDAYPVERTVLSKPAIKLPKNLGYRNAAKLKSLSSDKELYRRNFNPPRYYWKTIYPSEKSYQFYRRWYQSQALPRQQRFYYPNPTQSQYHNRNMIPSIGASYQGFQSYNPAYNHKYQHFYVRDEVPKRPGDVKRKSLEHRSTTHHRFIAPVKYIKEEKTSRRSSKGVTGQHVMGETSLKNLKNTLTRSNQKKPRAAVKTKARNSNGAQSSGTLTGRANKIVSSRRVKLASKFTKTVSGNKRLTIPNGIQMVPLKANTVQLLNWHSNGLPRSAHIFQKRVPGLMTRHEILSKQNNTESKPVVGNNYAHTNGNTTTNASLVLKDGSSVTVKNQTLAENKSTYNATGGEKRKMIHAELLEIISRTGVSHFSKNLIRDLEARGYIKSSNNTALQNADTTELTETVEQINPSSASNFTVSSIKDNTKENESLAGDGKSRIINKIMNNRNNTFVAIEIADDEVEKDERRLKEKALMHNMKTSKLEQAKKEIEKEELTKMKDSVTFDNAVSSMLYNAKNARKNHFYSNSTGILRDIDAIQYLRSNGTLLNQTESTQSTTDRLSNSMEPKEKPIGPMTKKNVTKNEKNKNPTYPIVIKAPSPTLSHKKQLANLTSHVEDGKKPTGSQKKISKTRPPSNPRPSETMIEQSIPNIEQKEDKNDGWVNFVPSIPSFMKGNYGEEMGIVNDTVLFEPLMKENGTSKHTDHINFDKLHIPKEIEAVYTDRMDDNEALKTAAMDYDDSAFKAYENHDTINGDWFDTGFHPDLITKQDIKMSKSGFINKLMLEQRAKLEKGKLPKKVPTTKSMEEKIKKIVNAAEMSEDSELQKLITDSIGPTLNEEKAVKPIKYFKNITDMIQPVSDTESMKHVKGDNSQVVKLMTEYATELASHGGNDTVLTLPEEAVTKADILKNIDIHAQQEINTLKNELSGSVYQKEKGNTFDYFSKNLSNEALLNELGEKKRFHTSLPEHSSSRDFNENLAKLDITSLYNPDPVAGSDSSSESSTNKEPNFRKHKLGKNKNNDDFEKLSNKWKKIKQQNKHIAEEEYEHLGEKTSSTDDAKNSLLNSYFRELETKLGSKSSSNHQVKRQKKIKDTLKMINDIETQIDSMIHSSTDKPIERTVKPHKKGKAAIFNELVGSHSNTATPRRKGKVRKNKSRAEKFNNKDKNEEEEKKEEELEDNDDDTESYQATPTVRKQYEDDYIENFRGDNNLEDTSLLKRKNYKSRHLKQPHHIGPKRDENNIASVIASSDLAERQQQAGVLLNFQQQEVNDDLLRLKEVTQAGLQSMFAKAVAKQQKFMDDVQSAPQDYLNSDLRARDQLQDSPSTSEYLGHTIPYQSIDNNMQELSQPDLRSIPLPAPENLDINNDDELSNGSRKSDVAEREDFDDDSMDNDNDTRDESDDDYYDEDDGR